jgi:hypothetical protein
MSSSDVANLKPTEILALVVLMAEARELTNNELKELAGFTLTGKENDRLEKQLGLVQTDRSHRPYAHQLTDRGWRVARELHAAPPPRGSGSAVRSLLTLLANLHRSLDRLQVSLPEFFKQTAQPTANPPAEPAEPAAPPVAAGRDVAARIRAAYAELASAPGDWVGLADLRDRLGDLDRASVDDALRALLRHEGVRIIPVANTKALHPRDRAAALRIGDEDNHTLSIGSK